VTWVFALILTACSGDSTPPDPVPAPTPPPIEQAPPEPPPPLPAPTADRYAASHVLVAWKGAVDAPASVVRTESEAQTLANSLRDRALAGDDFAALAAEFSDGPSARRGGSLGTYLTGTMVPDFEAAVASVEAGAVGPLVKSPFGWHVVRHDAFVQAKISHILVSYKGAASSSQTRSKEDARARIDEVVGKLAAGQSFAELAAEYSDDQTGKTGGDLGWVAPGQMVPAFETAALALDVSATSPVTETAYGFHVLKRTK